MNLNSMFLIAVTPITRSVPIKCPCSNMCTYVMFPICSSDYVRTYSYSRKKNA